MYLYMCVCACSQLQLRIPFQNLINQKIILFKCVVAFLNSQYSVMLHFLSRQKRIIPIYNHNDVKVLKVF